MDTKKTTNDKDEQIFNNDCEAVDDQYEYDCDDDDYYMSDIEAQIAEDRRAKYEALDKMTPEEWKQRERDLSRRMREFAKKHKSKIETVSLEDLPADKPDKDE